MVPAIGVLNTDADERLFQEAAISIGEVKCLALSWLQFKHWKPGAKWTNAFLREICRVAFYWSEQPMLCAEAPVQSFSGKAAV